MGWLRVPIPASTASIDAHARIDALELAMLVNLPLVDQPLVHRFLPGLYVRQVTNPAGSLVTTKIHATRHPFVLLRGRLSVYSMDGGVEHLEAPHFGITEPGTRRVIYAHEDSVFLTFHPNPDNEEDLDAIEARLIERRELTDGATAHDFFQRILAERRLAEAAS